jgi:hypothetical protein
MKAEKHFTAYSDLEWASIKPRVKDVCERNPDNVTVERRPGAGIYIGLRDELERIGREHCQRSPREKTPIEQRKFLKGKRKHVDACRREVVDNGDLPELQRKQLADALTEVDRLYARQIEDLGDLQFTQSFLNAAKPHVDEYFDELIDIWFQIGGRLEKRRAKLPSFLQTCAEPVIGRKSASLGQINKHLRGLLYSAKRA